MIKTKPISSEDLIYFKKHHINNIIRYATTTNNVLGLRFITEHFEGFIDYMRTYITNE